MEGIIEDAGPSQHSPAHFVRAEGKHATNTVFRSPAARRVEKRTKAPDIGGGRRGLPREHHPGAVVNTRGRARTVHFSRDILPILSENCFTCHGPDARARKAELRLDLKETALRTKDAVIVPGKSSESELIERVTARDADQIMPPPRSGKTLTTREIQLLKTWIDQGAQWSKHWAFEPVKRPLVPPGAQSCTGREMRLTGLSWRAWRQRAWRPPRPPNDRP